MSWAIWVTGPAGSGKSKLTGAVAARLRAEGRPVIVLAVDMMRRIVTPLPTRSATEHDAVHRALVWVTATLVEAGVPVLVDAAAHRREWRELARAFISNFAEVQLTGADGASVDVEYEPATDPELRVDAWTMAGAEAVARTCELARGLPVPPASEPGPGWAIWVTGLPGSGKTTITSLASEALAAHGIVTRILDGADLLGFVAGGGVTPLIDTVAHRTLVYAAKTLSEAGQAVIVDATAPARIWREMARALIPRFAEVQLLCPAGLCATRERVVRWRLAGCPHMAPPPHTEVPGVVPAYEPSLDPELMIHTDAQDAWSAAAAVVVLAQHLHAAPSEGRWMATTAR